MSCYERVQYQKKTTLRKNNYIYFVFVVSSRLDLFLFNLIGRRVARQRSIHSSSLQRHKLADRSRPPEDSWEGAVLCLHDIIASKW